MDVPHYGAIGASFLRRVRDGSERVKSSRHERAGFLFGLPEYNAAFRTCFDEALHGLVGEKAPLLKEIPTERVQHVPATHVTAPSGEVVSNPPLATPLPFRFTTGDVTEFNLSAFAASCDAAAEMLTDATLDHLLAYTERISDAFGTAGSAGGQPFGWPVILKGLEKVEIDFDERNEAILPTLVSSRDKRKIVPYPPMSDADREAFDALMTRKRQEFDARRRTRKLR